MVRPLKARPDPRGRRPSGQARDDHGQWLLLSAVVAAFGLGVIVILLNAAVMNGHSSMNSITLFPKNDIRDLRGASISEAFILGERLNGNNSILNKTDMFNASYDHFLAEANRLYQAQGAVTDVRYVPNTVNITLGDGSSIAKIVNVSLVIAYYDSDTSYIENLSVGT